MFSLPCRFGDGEENHAGVVRGEGGVFAYPSHGCAGVVGIDSTVGSCAAGTEPPGPVQTGRRDGALLVPTGNPPMALFGYFVYPAADGLRTQAPAGDPADVPILLAI